MNQEKFGMFGKDESGNEGTYLSKSPNLMDRKDVDNIDDKAVKLNLHKVQTK